MTQAEFHEQELVEQRVALILERLESVLDQDELSLMYWATGIQRQEKKA